MARNDKDSELFLGLITTVGTDTSDVVSTIKDKLLSVHYRTVEITVSKDIMSQFETTPFDPQGNEYTRTMHYIDLGNQIREKSQDNSILMKGVSSHIYKMRARDDAGRTQPQKRTAYIIKSLKNPEEVQYMRDTYGDGFYLIGITSSYERRLNYLTNRKNMSQAQAEELLIRDTDESIHQGQHTRDAFQHSDFFMNVNANSDSMVGAITRLVYLLFGNPFLTPTFDEYGMFMAYVSSLRSADLSRQVGAVIAKQDEILAMGANDCPRFGGGLYWPDQGDHNTFTDVPYGRDYMLGYDSNKREQRDIIVSLLTQFNIEPTEEAINKAKKTEIGDLTEYGRVVHGEMEALLSCARNNISCRGSTLYVTTFPCHNCAKHIIAAGISKVVYIEPYPKSKAFQFYRVEISDDKHSGNKVVFEPFVGVGPQKYIDLFAMSSDKWYSRRRKDKDGNCIRWITDTAELRTPIASMTWLEAEKAAYVNFEEETIAIKGEGSNV